MGEGFFSEDFRLRGEEDDEVAGEFSSTSEDEEDGAALSEGAAVSCDGDRSSCQVTERLLGDRADATDSSR